MGHMGGRGWAAAAAAGGRTRACVRRPAPWWRAWRSAACAVGGAAGLRRHLVCAHRGCWGGAVRQTRGWCGWRRRVVLRDCVAREAEA